MNRSRSKFINFIKICNAALCLFQIATSIVQKFLTDWFNVFSNITGLCQWCTINLRKWNIQEIRQSLDFWLEILGWFFIERTFIMWVLPEPVGPKTIIFDFSKSKSSTCSSSPSLDDFSENIFQTKFTNETILGVGYRGDYAYRVVLHYSNTHQMADHQDKTEIKF